jgi:hypothetical protein
MPGARTLDARVFRDRFDAPHAFPESPESAYFGLAYCAGRTTLKHCALGSKITQLELQREKQWA